MDRTVFLDTSAVLAVLLDEPIRPAILSLTNGCNLVAASSLPFETGNALIAGFRRKRLSADQVEAAWASYQRIPVRLAEIDVPQALQSSMDLGLYAYDGYVLETARQERLPLLTLDNGITRAAQRLGLKLVEVEQ